MKSKKVEETVCEQVIIKRPNWKFVEVPIQATPGMPMIMQKLHEKTVIEMTDKEFGIPKKKKIRNEDDEYDRCFHRMPEDENQFGFPTSGFYGGMLFVAPELGIHKTTIKRCIKILGRLAPLDYEKIERTLDTPKRAGMTGAPDRRWRPYFHGWSTVLQVKYNADVVTIDSVVNLIAHAGESAGVGAWRPSSPKGPGPYGTYEPVYGKISKEGDDNND